VVDLELCLVIGGPGGCQGVEQLKEGCGKAVQLLQGVKLLLCQAWCQLEVWVVLDGGCQGITGSAKGGHQACRERGRDKGMEVAAALSATQQTWQEASSQTRSGDS